MKRSKLTTFDEIHLESLDFVLKQDAKLNTESQFRFNSVNRTEVWIIYYILTAETQSSTEPRDASRTRSMSTVFFVV